MILYGLLNLLIIKTHYMNKKILQLIIVMLFAMSGVMAQTVQLGHVTNAVPGTVTVPLNMPGAYLE